MNVVIALDFDDCILPSNSNYFGRTNDALVLLEINLKRLKLILDKYNAKVVITSSWYSQLTLNSFNEINLKDRELNVPLELKPLYKFENMAFALLKNYLDGYVIKLSCGCRETDIRDLYNDNKVIILDDWDLQHIADEHANCLYCKTIGLLDGNIGFMIHQFLEKDLKETRGIDK